MNISVITNSILMGDIAETVGEIFDAISLWFDDIIYSGVSGLYTIFMALTKLNFRDAFPALETFKNNIFLILGVFMLFVVAFSLLKLLLDPDKVADKTAGAPAIVKNIFISLVLVIVIQPAFDMIYEAQTALIENQVVNKIVMGSGSSTEIEGSKALGESFAYTAWISFFTQNNGYMCSGNNTMCENIARDVATGVIRSMSISDTLDHLESDSITYHKFFSCIGGLFIFVMLITFIIDVAVRAFKLMLYEAVAPIAIFSYIVPNMQNNLFTWLKSVVSTFLDLFIRIASMLFAIILISNVGNAFAEDALQELSGISSVLAYFFLVIAILTFAKMIPKLIGDLFGVKLGTNSINPFKNNEFFAAGAGGVIGGSIGTVGGAIAGARANGLSGFARGIVHGGVRGAFNGGKQKGVIPAAKAGGRSAIATGKFEKGVKDSGGFFRKMLGLNQPSKDSNKEKSVPASSNQYSIPASNKNNSQSQVKKDTPEIPYENAVDYNNEYLNSQNQYLPQNNRNQENMNEEYADHIGPDFYGISDSDRVVTKDNKLNEKEKQDVGEFFGPYYEEDAKVNKEKEQPKVTKAVADDKTDGGWDDINQYMKW